MFRRVSRVLALVLPLVAVVSASCGTPTEPTDPTPPSPTAGLVPVTDSFSGTLASGGANLHTFHTMPGLVKVTLVSLNPSDAPLIGLEIGMWDGLSCQTVLQVPFGQAGTDLTATASVETQVCVKVWDVGTLAAESSVKYQLSAVHNEKPSS